MDKNSISTRTFWQVGINIKLTTVMLDVNGILCVKDRIVQWPSTPN